MRIVLAQHEDIPGIARLDSHIPVRQLQECVAHGRVYVLKDPIAGILRYSLFWQTIPFLDLLYLEQAFRKQGYGTQMMRVWEEAMGSLGYRHVMTSTQADEDAWQFYEKLGYRRIGGFYPPGQDAEEILYLKELAGSVSGQ